MKNFIKNEVIPALIVLITVLGFIYVLCLLA